MNSLFSICSHARNRLYRFSASTVHDLSRPHVSSFRDQYRADMLGGVHLFRRGVDACRRLSSPKLPIPSSATTLALSAFGQKLTSHASSTDLKDALRRSAKSTWRKRKHILSGIAELR
jgi:hypothetical protein